MTGKLTVLRGDITKLVVDAIVNAANEALRPGGGVDGAIRRAAGPKINEATRRIGHCPTGQAVITDGFDLPARKVIHTAGPVWHGGDTGEAELLAACYRNSLRLAVENGIRRLAFPAISTGIYGYPPEQAAAIAVREVRAALADQAALEEVILVAFGAADHALLARAAAADGGAGR